MLESTSSLRPGYFCATAPANGARKSKQMNGLLEHEKAKAAGLTDGDESIQIFFHVIRHPTRGLFLVDTGVETALRDAPEKSALSG
ncbi:MAG TPA: hypothetical protein VGE37_11575, partial [Archangium sp.]